MFHVIIVFTNSTYPTKSIILGLFLSGREMFRSEQRIINTEVFNSAAYVCCPSNQFAGKSDIFGSELVIIVVEKTFAAWYNFDVVELPFHFQHPNTLYTL